MATQNPMIQALLDDLAGQAGISQSFIEAGDHPIVCRCDKCLEWWTTMPDEDPKNPSYGPFSAQEVEAYRAQHGG